MRKKILLAGGTGLVGQRMVDLYQKNYDLHILSRSAHPNTSNISYYQWDLDNMEIDTDALKVDYIINLNGAGIADKRWTSERKKILIESRVKSNELLVKGLKEIGHKVTGFACASAVGFYGDRGEEKLYEDSSSGKGFMADCCVQWEKSAYGMKEYTDLLSIIRIGIVLSTKDGALPKILMTKPLGVLSYFGDGRQYYSWIHIDDLCEIFLLSITNDKYAGIINGVTPQSLPNKDFIQKIKSGLDSNALVVPAPAFGLRLAMGDMADVVLNSNRVVPQVLLDHGFEWQYAHVGDAVKHLVDNEV